jgi:site-specific recombinase XerD
MYLFTRLRKLGEELHRLKIDQQQQIQVQDVAEIVRQHAASPESQQTQQEVVSRIVWHYLYQYHLQQQQLLATSETPQQQLETPATTLTTAVPLADEEHCDSPPLSITSETRPE